MSGASPDETLMVMPAWRRRKVSAVSRFSIPRGCPLLTTWEMRGLSLPGAYLVGEGRGSPPFACSQSQCLRGGPDDGHAGMCRAADGTVALDVHDPAGSEVDGRAVRHHRLAADEAEPHEISLTGV